MNQGGVIREVARIVRAKLLGEGSGHDWWHIYRVWNLAKKIGKAEGGNIFIIELTALLHDIADWKFNNGDETAGPREARRILQSLKVDESIITHVEDSILHMSFKGAGVKHTMKTIEGKIVQDADRLDAMGAIGIGRTFAYGGATGREMYNPNIKPVLHKSFSAYKKAFSPTINHFYEKLLLLKDRINTKTAKQIAAKRHKVMKQFVKEFLNEWNQK